MPFINALHRRQREVKGQWQHADDVVGHNLSQHADDRLSFMLLATTCPIMLTTGYLSCCWPHPVPACWQQAIFHVAGHNLSQHADDRLSFMLLATTYADDRLSFMLLATTCPSMLMTGYLSGPSPWHSYFTLPIIRPLAVLLLNVQQWWIGSLLKNVFKYFWCTNGIHISTSRKRNVCFLVSLS